MIWKRETGHPDRNLPTQFLPKFKDDFEHQAQQRINLSILHFAFDLNCNVSNMHYIIHKM